MLEDQPVFASTRLALIAVTEHILRLRRLLGNERPLHPRGEPGAAASPQSGVLDLVDNGVRVHPKRLLHGFVAIQFEITVDVRRTLAEAPGNDLYFVGM